MLQLAIYHKLLTIAQPDKSFCGLLEYYEPELEVVLVNSDLLSALYTTKVAPVIQALAAANDSVNVPLEPSTTKSKFKQLRSGLEKNGTSNKHSTAHNSDVTGEQRSQALVDALAEFRLGVQVLEVIEAPQLIRYQLRPQS